MCPHSQDANDFFPFIYLVNQTVLNINSARIRAFEIADELFIRRRILKRILT